MALALSASYEVSNDNTILTVTDSNCLVSDAGWGVGTNPSFTDLDGIDYNLTLDIKVTNSSETEIEYDSIDLVSEYGPFVSHEDMIFQLTGLELKINGAAIGTDETELEEGIWEFTYTLEYVVDGYSVESESSILNMNKSKYNVYEKLRVLPTSYMCKDCCNSNEVRNAIFAKNYLDSLEMAFELEDTSDILNNLYTLQRMLLTGFDCKW